MEPINQLIKIRQNKLKKIIDLGINPYPSISKRNQIIAQARKNIGKKYTLAGRLMAIRGHGKMMFADIIDQSGKIQVVLKKDLLSPKTFKLIQLLDIGDFIQTSGPIFQTQKGEISQKVTNLTILCKAFRPLPSKWHGLKDVEERYRKRYIDLLINPQTKKTLQIRSSVISTIRQFLNSQGFIEVETPTLQPIYGGGLARPFITHHNSLNSNFYLRISDEMYLKRLIVGGFEKIYEITKVFRNEGIDHDHNPEFTAFEAMIAYKDYIYGMELIEKIIEHVAQKILKTTTIKYQGTTINLKRPWKKYKVVEAIKKICGIDPAQWQTLNQAKKAAASLKIDQNKLKQIKPMRSIGEIIAFIFEEAVEEKLIQPTIIYDYPVEVSPLAKKCQNPQFTQRFEMFAFGSELGNNYTELNNPLELKKRFIEEKKREKAGFKEAHQTDYDYLTAIEHGLPPTCGISIGIDRLVMLLTNSANIREVIAFPTLKPKKT